MQKDNELIDEKHEENNVEANVKIRGNNRTSLIFGVLFFVFLVFTLVAYFVVLPNFLRMKKQQCKKDCISNMKTIEGAVELYLMEKGAKIQGYELKMDELLKEKFLKNTMKCPSGGIYEIVVGQATGGASGQTIIKCSIHKTIDDIPGCL